MNGIGALLYLFDLCFTAFCRITKTPVGVSCPGAPVETVETPIGAPFR